MSLPAGVMNELELQFQLIHGTSQNTTMGSPCTKIGLQLILYSYRPYNVLQSPRNMTDIFVRR
jgi:hypothetical protein